ncbi:MAG TPA: hypothetical protein VNY09_01880 [Candidatus Sulfotelmatobacter sp.]|nr:hypothetical protein [Candidatus Sulfotelmatobacter sp.]
MSIIGILSSNLFAAGAAQNTQSAQNTGNNPSKFQQIKAEFQQLGQDLQSGNLTQAQKDYTTLSQNLPGLPQAQNTANPLVQAFNQLGQDLQSGNVQAAQSDYATVQQDAQQNAAHASGHHHHHHRAEGSQESGSNPQTNSINTAFSQLAESLQAGSLSGAQSAFATLQSDLQQIGGFLPLFVAGGSGTASAAPAQSNSSSLSVSA